jgi:hypothetical protein
VRAKKSVERQLKQGGGLRPTLATKMAKDHLGIKDKPIKKKKPSDSLFTGDGGKADERDRGMGAKRRAAESGKGSKGDDEKKKKFVGKLRNGKQVGGRKAFKSNKRFKRR